MAKNKVGLQFEGFEETIARLKELEGDVKKVTEEALFKSKKVATDELLSITVKSNFPAKGKYSQGDVRKSINLDNKVEWEGTMASIPVGFNLERNGLVSIFLMYGTPRMPKVQGMYNAIYGSKAKRKIAKVQEEVFQKAIAERMGS